MEEKAYILFFLGLLFGLIFLLGGLFYIINKDKKVKDEPKRGIRIVMDSGDSNGFYTIMEIIKENKPEILGAEYYDSITDTLTINLIVSDAAFDRIFHQVKELENVESVETEIEVKEN